MAKRYRSTVPPAMLAFVAVSIAAFAPVQSWASLGGDVASVQADEIHLQGHRTMKAAQSYTVHEIQGSSGTVVREYVSPAGRVFAIAWHGAWMPDMRQLLGHYFDQYARANQTASQTQKSVRLRRGPVLINEAGLVVQIGGHPRAFAGRAYVPETLPAGVRAEDIQ